MRNYVSVVVSLASSESVTAGSDITVLKQNFIYLAN